MKSNAPIVVARTAVSILPCPEIITTEASTPTARNWLGADALRRSDVAAAAMHFHIACKREPGERSHWINLATARRILGDGDAERAALEQALTIDQTDLLALVRMAELHERLGEEAPAAERWAAVLALGSNIRDPAPVLAFIGHVRSGSSLQYSATPSTMSGGSNKS